LPCVASYGLGKLTSVAPQFMVDYTVSLVKSFDIRSEAAIRLLAEFLDIGREDERRTAEHVSDIGSGWRVGSARV
jgi:hypothetical protein